MINRDMRALGEAPSTIRELFAYGMARKAEIGEDNVFDFSIGNPNVPAPASVRAAIHEAADLPPEKIHGYTAAQGTTQTRKAVADSLNKRFGTSYGPDDLYMTLGAAASLNISMNAIGHAGDDMIVISPYFPEYRVWIEALGAHCIEVPARESDFQIDCEAVAAAITPRTSAVIINSPNNPVGTVYSQQNLQDLARVLYDAGKRNGAPVYLISDEPYRELVYGNVQVPWVAGLYDYTLVCYSWSKSLSLPGERIGYILVPPNMPDARAVYAAVCGAGRALGFVCATSLFQYVIARCVNEPADVEAYARNRDLLCDILDRYGYEYIEPQGAFYLWVRALEPDAKAFSERAKAHELLLVPSDSFGVSGWVRFGYCVAQQVIVNSEPALAELKAEYE